MITLSSRQKTILAAIFLAAATFVLYSPALKNDFIGWDDVYYVLENPFITPLTPAMVGQMFTSFHFKSYTPLTLLSHAIDYRLWGLDPRGHHLVNILLHCTNAVLFFFLVKGLMQRVLRQRDGVGSTAGRSELIGEDHLVVGALIGALLFAVHPLRVESVACVSSRKDLLSTLLAFIVLQLYIGYASDRDGHGHRWRFHASWFFFVFGLLAKGSLMTLPAIMLLLDVAMLGPGQSAKQWTRLIKEKIPFAVPALAAAVVAYLASEGTHGAQALRAHADVNRFELGLYNLAFYVGKTVWPVDLAELYTYPERVWLFRLTSASTLIITAGAAILWRKGARAWMLTWGAYIVGLLPMAGFVPSSIQVIANRYAYFSAASFAVLSAAGVVLFLQGGTIQRFRWMKAGVPLMLLGILAALCMRTSIHIGDWRNAETVWERTIQVSPGHALAHNEMGLALEEKGEYHQAIRYYTRALELSPTFYEVYCNLGGAFISLRDTINAERVLLKAIEALPADAQSYINLGNVRVQQKRYDEALEYYRKGLTLNRRSAIAAYNIGFVLNIQGKYDEAEEMLWRAVRLNPNYGDAFYLLGSVIVRQGNDIRGAVEVYQRAARLGHIESQKTLVGMGIDW